VSIEDIIAKFESLNNEAQAERVAGLLSELLGRAIERVKRVRNIRENMVHGLEGRNIASTLVSSV
jgi:hypothetical protein